MIASAGPTCRISQLGSPGRSFSATFRSGRADDVCPGAPDVTGLAEHPASPATAAAPGIATAAPRKILRLWERGKRLTFRACPVTAAVRSLLVLACRQRARIRRLRAGHHVRAWRSLHIAVDVHAGEVQDPEHRRA